MLRGTGQALPDRGRPHRQVLDRRSRVGGGRGPRHPARRGARAAWIVARTVEELPDRERTVAIGSFDGVHVGHRHVLETARAAGGPTTVVTFWPHPRLVLGNRVELLSTLERRLELPDAIGVDEALVVSFTPGLAGLEPEELAGSPLRPRRAAGVVVGGDFRLWRVAFR